MSGPLTSLVAAEIARPLPDAVSAFAAHLAGTAPRPPLAVIFYGSNLRSGRLDGVLDFYVLVERMRDWHEGVAAIFDTLLAPRIEYRELLLEGVLLRAKVSIISIERFNRLIRPESLDTTLWARFCQPVALGWVRDEAARVRVDASIVRAIVTASRWAAYVGPEQGTPRDFWRALFEHTYSVELRVEAGRAEDLLARAGIRFDALLAPAWNEAGIAYVELPEGVFAPQHSRGELDRAKRAWGWRKRLGKPLNLARLGKAAFSFSGGAGYLSWKIERHTGISLALTPWQQRHPLLAAPRVLWRLWRQGIFK